jgi:hypothetical protein
LFTNRATRSAVIPSARRPHARHDAQLFSVSSRTRSPGFGERR